MQTYQELLAENAALKKENAALKSRGAALEAQVIQLLARVRELELQLKRNSRNSSRAPSSDPPSVPRPAKEPSGRKCGAQQGHEGHVKELLPPDKVDCVVTVKPPKCKDCGAALASDDPNPCRSR